MCVRATRCGSRKGRVETPFGWQIKPARSCDPPALRASPQQVCHGKSRIYMQISRGWKTWKYNMRNWNWHQLAQWSTDSNPQWPKLQVQSNPMTYNIIRSCCPGKPRPKLLAQITAVTIGQLIDMIIITKYSDNRWMIKGASPAKIAEKTYFVCHISYKTKYIWHLKDIFKELWWIFCVLWTKQFIS